MTLMDPRTRYSRQQEIIDQATDEQRKQLQNDHYYGSPQSFWSTAVAYKLATTEEYYQAKAAMGNLWNYRGD